MFTWRGGVGCILKTLHIWNKNNPVFYIKNIRCKVENEREKEIILENIIEDHI